MKKRLLKTVFFFFFALWSFHVLAQESNNWQIATSYGKYGFKDATGKLKIETLYDDAKLFNNGMARVKKDGQWGFINEYGNKLIDFLYDDALDFQGSLAAVNKFGQWGFVDRNGKIIINFQFDEVGSFTDSLTWVRQVRNVGFINKTGNLVIPVQYAAAGNFADGLAPVAMNGKWAFIDKNGIIVIDFLFDEVRSFKDGLAPVMLNNKWGYIDTKGNLVITYQFDDANENNQTLEFGWKYAETTYLLSKASAEKEKKVYKNQLKKALKIIDKADASINFGIPEWEKLKLYYIELKENDHVKVADLKIKNLKKGNVVEKDKDKKERNPTKSVDFSLATAPVKWAMKENSKYPMHQIPLYAELRIVRFAMGVRYNQYTDYKDQFKFGAWLNTNKDSASNVYSGKEYSLILKFLSKGHIKKGIAGFGFSGSYSGLEFRYSDLQFKPILTDIESKTSTDNFKDALLQPNVKVYDLCYNFGFSRSRGIFFFDVGMSLGFGVREYKMEELKTHKIMNVQENTFSNPKLKSEYWMPVYFPCRVHFRMGINLF